VRASRGRRRSLCDPRGARLPLSASGERGPRCVCGPGVLQPVIDRAFPFTAAVEALRYDGAGKYFGKIAINHG